MDRVMVIGNGIAGCSCAVRLAEAGIEVLLVALGPSERTQSVMAAGGINAVLGDCEPGDSISCHVQDTLRGGQNLAGESAVHGLCEHASEVIEYLERIGTVFTLDTDGRPARRAFGGQTHRRTYYCGSSTGKQIVSALVMETRRLQAAGLIRTRFWNHFHSALIRDGRCFGAMLFDYRNNTLVAERTDAVVVATGGQNALFGKTTGSTLCDGYAAGRLLMQGVDLKNLEFVQYHPTTLETSQKRMLISEAARGEGARLFYFEGGRRVYFMEEKYGSKGNLMPRDVVSREIAATGREVFLDASFLGEDLIESRLFEVRDICLRYGGTDIAREPVRVAPSVHFFMGGIAVDNYHETSVENLFAVGECASIYHGANRLGGNSLLAAVYGGWVAGDALKGREGSSVLPDFTHELHAERNRLERMGKSKSSFPVTYVRDLLAKTMVKAMGVTRDEETLEQGISDVDYYLSVADGLRLDPNPAMYDNYSLTGTLSLAKSALVSAQQRRESRGAHNRSDHPHEEEAMCFPSVVSYDDGRYRVWLDKDGRYER